MANYRTESPETREIIQRHRDNRVTIVAVAAVIVAVIVAGALYFGHRDTLATQAVTDQANAAAQAQTAQTNADAQTAMARSQILQAQAASQAAAQAAAAEADAARPAPVVIHEQAPAAETPPAEAPAQNQ